MIGIYTITPAATMNWLPSEWMGRKFFSILKCIKRSFLMVNNQLTGDISDKLRLGFDQARLKFLEQKARKNGIVIVSDMEGNATQVPAKELLIATRSKSAQKGNNKGVK
jgi:hypothetical protein